MPRVFVSTIHSTTEQSLFQTNQNSLLLILYLPVQPFEKFMTESIGRNSARDEVYTRSSSTEPHNAICTLSRQEARGKSVHEIGLLKFSDEQVCEWTGTHLSE